MLRMFGNVRNYQQLKQLLPKGEFRLNVLTLMAGTTVAQAIYIAISPILTRIYTPKDFGIFAFYIAIIGVISTASTGRYELAVIRPQEDADADALVVLSVWLSGAISLFSLVVIIIFNNTLAQVIGNTAIGSWLYVVPIAVFFVGVYNTLNYWLNRHKRYASMSTNRITQSTINSILSLSFGLTNIGVGGLIISHLLGQFVTVIMLAKQFISSNRAHNVYWLKLETFKVVASQYKNHPLYLLPSHFIGVAATQLPVLIMSSLYGASTIGFHELATRIGGIPTLLVARAIGDVYRQQASSLYSERKGFRSLFFVTIFKSTLFAFIPFLLMFIFSPYIFVLVFGEAWRVAGEYARILAVETYIGFVFSTVDSGALIVGATNYIAFWHVLRLSINLIIVAISYTYDIRFESYLYLQTICNSLLYLTDIFVQYSLSSGWKFHTQE